MSVSAAEFEVLKAQMAAYGDRIDRLERALADQAAGLAAARGQITSLISQLNERLLPGIDERMDETERDLAGLATRLVRADQDTVRRESRLGTAEQRIGDLRGKVGRIEERAGLWRELQANVARLGEDIDQMRARLLDRLLERAGEPVGNPVGDREVHP